MEEQARRSFATLAAILAVIVYFFVFARPLPRALELRAVWSDAAAAPGLAQAAGTRASGSDLPFEVGDEYGYFDPAKGLRFVAKKTFGVSLSKELYATYDRSPGTLSWKDPGGDLRFETQEPGYPFMAGGRRFLVGPNQSTVTEIGRSGEILWRRDFPSLLTAFDASADLALFGTLDGTLIGITPSGKEVLSFAPGGSRVSCIYGCAVSSDGMTVAAISGHDRQRLVVLEKRAEAYRVAYHRWLASDFTRPIAMSFTESREQLLFETEGGVGIYDAAARREHLLEAESPQGLGAAIPARRLLLAVEGGTRTSLVVSTYEGQRLFTFAFEGEEPMLAREGDSVFLGLRRPEGMRMLRLDLGEE